MKQKPQKISTKKKIKLIYFLFQQSHEDDLAPEIIGIEAWINSNGEKIADLKGKVVLIDFWTYSCINCIRTLPYVTSWYDKYKDDGFVIIGVHTPEFAFEKKLENVQEAVKEFKINYPVALDNDYKTWRNYNNRYWPAHYLIDKNGVIRDTHFGEGKYKETEMKIRELLEEDGTTLKQAISKYSEDNPFSRGQSPETYLGYARLDNFANKKELNKDDIVDYKLVEKLDSDEWTIGGEWEITGENLISAANQTQLNLKFNAKNVFLVMGAERESNVQVMLNGQKVGAMEKGEDVDENGVMNVSEFKLYRLIEADEFLENNELGLVFPEGVRAFAFTFGS